MRKILTGIFLLYSFICAAQKQKKDYEYQDTRKKNETFARLPADLKAELSTFTFSGIDVGITKEPLKKISYTSLGHDFMTFEGNEIKATVTTTSFEAWKHKIDYDEQYPIKIDKKPYYGNYGSMPKTYIKQVSIVIGKDSVIIPPSAYADLYNLNFAYSDNGTQKTTNGIYLSRNTHRVYLYLFCKDNSGSYEVTWIIYDKKYIRRVLDYGFM